MALTKFTIRFKFKHVPEYSARLAELKRKDRNILDVI